MSITVSPFAAGLGADIGGVDIRETLSIADRDAMDLWTALISGLMTAAILAATWKISPRRG